MTRASKPNQAERAQRHTAIDALLQRALRGMLTIPEAAVLADYWRTEQRLADKTRESLAATTRAIERHRRAADAAIREAEQQRDQLANAVRAVLDPHRPLTAEALETLAHAMPDATPTPTTAGYCPHCGRGDLAPTAEDWEQQRQRADQAEAAIARVRDTTAYMRSTTRTWEPAANLIEDALEGAEPPRREQPHEHCGHLSPETALTNPRTECVLRPGHSGSHADDRGCRWWFTPSAALRDCRIAASGGFACPPADPCATCDPHDAGPSVREAAADDRAYWNDQYAGDTNG